MKTAEALAAEIIESFTGFRFDRHDLGGRIAAALEDYHQSRLQEALRRMLNDTPPLSEAQVREIRELIGGDVQSPAEAILEDRDHYRDLARALLQELENDKPGAAELYQAGLKAGMAEMKRRCLEALCREVSPFDESLEVVRRVSAEPSPEATPESHAVEP